MFDFLSVNARGIRDQLETRSKNIFLQDTYSKPSDEMIWMSKWGGEIFFHKELNTAKGVCILIPPLMRCKLILNSNRGRLVFNYN